MPIAATRAMLHAVLEGRLAGTATRTDPTFGFEVPLAVPDVESALLDPRSTWADPARYDEKARQLAAMFAENFVRRFADVDEAIRAAGPSSS
jgi:phosphoenolpyruvate carboxykinase (ATP)